ncbi:MAG: hypothetical protein RLN60_05790 [Phycisphaerales bacterium]
MSSRLRHGERRGVALLLALLALVLLSSAAVPLLSTGHQVSRARFDAGESVASRLIVESLQPLLIDWSREHASEAQAPFFELIHRTDRNGRVVTVRAIDLSGRLHVSHLDTFAASEIPDPIRASVIDIDSQSRPRSGSSESPRRLLDEYFADDSAAPLFPMEFADRHTPSSILDWISAHGDPNRTNTQALNINGAPLALLRAALRGRDPSRAAQAIELRQQGLTVPNNLVSSLGGDGDDSIKRVPLRGTSNAFGFMVTLEQGPRTETYWLVTEALTGSWSCTERRRVERGGGR